MPYSAQQLDGLLDLLVEALLRELESEATKENGDVSGQEQRRRGDQANASLHITNPAD